jgi:hypothetical protein
MAVGLRWRAEAVPFAGLAPNTNFTPATRAFAAGTTILVAAASLVGIQRPGIYRVFLSSVAGGTFQFQDTSAGILSAQYTLAANQQFPAFTTYNGEPLWQPAAPGLGLQIVIGGTGPIFGDIWIALGG